MYSIEIMSIRNDAGQSKRVITHLSAYMAHVLAQKALEQEDTVKVEVFNDKNHIEETYERLKK